MISKKDGLLAVSAFLTGAALGAVVILLTAPRSGRESRERIRDLANDLRHRAEAVPHAAHEACCRARETFAESMRDA
jgi:gas vesicle protein